MSDERQALRDAARDLFAKHYPVGRLRELWEGADRDPDAWQAMVDMGLTELPDATWVVPVLEEAGRAGVPEPLLDSWAARAVVDLAPDETAAVSLGQPYATDADIATVVIVGGELARDVTYDRVTTEDRARRLFRIELRDAERIDAEPVRRRLLIGTAALLDGVARRLIEMTLDHVRTREQFGQPIGGFQAVKHQLATAHAALTASRAAVDLAAAGHLRPDVALIHAVGAESRANTTALQLHGGIGFTWEHDLHLFLKRGRALEAWAGSPRGHRAAIAARLVDGPDTPPA